MPEHKDDKFVILFIGTATTGAFSISPGPGTFVGTACTTGDFFGQIHRIRAVRNGLFLRFCVKGSVAS